MVDRCCSVPPEFGVLAPTAAPKSTRERPLATDHDLELLRSPATALWSLPGSLTMTLSASSMWGERGNAGVRWTGAGPLARIAVFGTFRQLRSFGTRCPPLSVWCGPHLCTSSYFCVSAADDYAPCPPTVPSPPPCPIISHATHSNFVSC